MKNIKSIVAVIFIGVGLGVLAMTMGGGKYASGPLLPQAIPFLGAPFGLGLTAAQVAFCILCDAKVGLLWIVAVWVLAVPLALLGNTMNLYPDTISGIDRLVTGPACASALVLASGVIHGKL